MEGVQACLFLLKTPVTYSDPALIQHTAATLSVRNVLFFLWRGRHFGLFSGSSCRRTALHDATVLSSLTYSSPILTHCIWQRELQPWISSCSGGGKDLSSTLPNPLLWCRLLWFTLTTALGNEMAKTFAFSRVVFLLLGGGAGLD